MIRTHRTYDHQHDERPPGAPGGGPPRESDPAAESLAQALRAGFNLLRLIMVVLLVAYFLSGWFQVNPGEQGLIVRFGKLRLNQNADSPYYQTPIFGEGWHAALPDPFDTKIRISGQTFKQTLYTFCFPLQDKDKKKKLSDINLAAIVPRLEKLQPGVHGAMLTGDRNLSHGIWSFEYRIEDAGKFVENIGDKPESFRHLLERVAENAVVRTVAGMPVERVIRTATDEAQADFTIEVRRRLNEELSRLDTGVKVVNVEAKTIEPGRVREAFVDVIKARADRKRKEEEANQQANKILSKAAGPREKYEALLAAIREYGAAQAAGADDARLAEMRAAIDRQLEQAQGEVAVRLRQAQYEANQIREEVQREYKLFVDYRNMFRQYPALTAVRLWIDMRKAILTSNDNEIFFVPKANELEIITNRDLQRQVEADIKRFKSRNEPKNQQGQ